MLNMEHLADGKSQSAPREQPAELASLPPSRAPAKPNVDDLLENLDGNFD